MNEMNDLEKRTLKLARVFNAPIDLVWKAWTQPAHIAQWWGPKGTKTTIVKHNFVENGEWRFSMPMPNGNEFISFGTYSTINEPTLIETSANFIPMTEGVTLVAQFEDKGSQTGFVFKVIHPTEAYCKQQEEMGFYNGWGSVFEGLNGYLESL